MYKFLLIALLSFFIVLPAFAQQDIDTTGTEEWDDWDDWEDEDWGDKFKGDIFDFKGSPTVSIFYGLTELNHKNLRRPFADPRSIELKIGHTDVDKTWQKEKILETSFKFLSVSNINTDLADLNDDETGYRTNNWRFGLGSNSGYGYSFGASALFLTSGSSLNWTRLKWYDNDGIAEDEGEITNLYHDNFRFGTAFEAGIRFQIIREINLEAGFERAVVFPRHLFWKWLGSAVIETSAQFMIDRFVEEILDSSPYFAPVMSFLLKNGLNYGIYELRKDKMNWPFNSTAPITAEQFKFGLTFVL
jgi:hypothetical protein